MTYVMSDLHGCCKQFLQMCETIRLEEKDDLFLLGDLVDRGPEPMPLLLECMQRPNVYPLMGNHEALFLRCAQQISPQATPENFFSGYFPFVHEVCTPWLQNGGEVTLMQFLALSPAQRQLVLAYLEEFSLHEHCVVEGVPYLLTHSGIRGYRKGKPLKEYEPDDFLQARPSVDTVYDNDAVLVFGHTPTLSFLPAAAQAEVLFTESYINVDCGAVFSGAGGRLACLRLDDRKVFYV
ncbi:MAG: metallophosphoesterase [Oscillospiraceae bacterium]|nr:metallophosphoesterase [Oscillospiraceae bacterium]